MENKKLKLDELIDATQKIIRAHDSSNEKLLFEVTKEDSAEIKELSELTNAQILADPKKSYDLYYHAIQNFLLSVLPKDEMIRDTILNLKCTFLSKQEKENITSGKRGADSRMATLDDMEIVIDIISDWSRTPYDYMRLANLFLEKNIELKYCPSNRVLADFIK